MRCPEIFFLKRSGALPEIFHTQRTMEFVVLLDKRSIANTGAFCKERQDFAPAGGYVLDLSSGFAHIASELAQLQDRLTYSMCWIRFLSVS